MVRQHDSILVQTGVALALAVGLALVLAFIAPAHAGIVDSFKQSWSEIGKSSSSKKSSIDDKKMNTGATGCFEGILNAKARGGTGIDMSAACAQGASQKIQEQEAQEEREKQELLARKDAASWGQRIDHVNQRIVDRQPRIERIEAEKSGDVPETKPEDVQMDKKCRSDAACRDAVVKAETEANHPGFFKGVWYWIFPGEAPKAKAELKGVEGDIEFLQRSIDEIKQAIEETEDKLYTEQSVKKKSDLARDKGVLVSEYSQANQALATLKTQQKELDHGYVAYLLMFIATIGGTAVKKFSEGTVHVGFDGVKHLLTRARARRRKQPKTADHNMYG